MARIRISGMCALRTWPWRYDLWSRSWLNLESQTTMCEILSLSNMAERSYGPDTDFECVSNVTLTFEIQHWVKAMTHPESWTTNVWNIIKIKPCSEELWPGHRFWICVHCDLHLGDTALCQGHGILLRNGQQLCELLFRSHLAVRSYGRDMDFGCVHYDLVLGDMTLG